MYNFIYGLGGRDVPVQDFTGMFEKVIADTDNKAKDTYEFWGVRE
jgi:pyruvate ferredoxin oxidoreductase alpha subunit